MGMYGADPLELRNLGSRLDDAVTGLRDVQRRLGIQIDRAPWTGADADQFRGQWRGPTRVTFEAASSSLRDAAASLRRNALEQERASGMLSDDAGTAGGDVPSAYLTLMPANDASAEEVRAWWEAQSDEQRAEWIENYSDSIGNRDGIPLEDRFAANRRTVEKRIEVLERIPGAEEEAERYRKLLSMARDEDGKPVDILYFDYSTNYVAVVHGDLATAAEVLITVSGTGSNFDKFVTNFGPEGELLTNSNRAVISTLVWDPPPNLLDNVSIEDYTKSFVGGPINSIISTADSEVGVVSLVGHSAGAVAIQELMVPSNGLVTLSTGDVAIPDTLVSPDSEVRATADMVDSVSLLAPSALNPELVEQMAGRDIFIALNTDDPMGDVDGLDTGWNGLGWNGGQDFKDVVEGEGPWSAQNVRWASEASGTDTNSVRSAAVVGGAAIVGGPPAALAAYEIDSRIQRSAAHGNSTYFNNYGDEIGILNSDGGFYSQSVTRA